MASPGRTGATAQSQPSRPGALVPELGVHCRAPARDTLLEGEIVIADDAGQAGFAALQHWLTLARKYIAHAVNQRSAILLA